MAIKVSILEETTLGEKVMFRFFYLKIALLSLLLAQAAFAQSGVKIIWQNNTGGSVLAYSGDGQLLLAGTRLFSAANGEFIRDFHLPYNGGGPNSVALSPDGQYAAVGIQGYNQNLDLFRVADGTLIAGRITAHSNGTTSVMFSPDGQLLATGGRDGTGKLWHVPDMTLLRTLNGGVGYRPRIFGVAFTRDGSMVALGGQGGIVLYRVADGELVREFVGANSTRTLTISPDNQFLVSSSNQIDQQGQCTDCALKVWRIADGALLQVIDSVDNYAISIACSPDSRVIAAGSEDRFNGGGLLRFWRSLDGALLRSINVNAGDPNDPYVTSVAYSPNGIAFAYAAINQQVTVIRNPIANKNIGR
jgi:WD40 repeat protein